MDKLNLSKLEAKKPLAIDSKGNFLSLKELEEEKPFMALASLELGMQKDLVLHRNEMEPDYEISIIGGERITKNELMDEIKAETELGMDAVRAELSYLSDIHAELGGQEIMKEELPDKVKVRPWPPDEHREIPRKWWPIFFRRFAVFAEDTSTAITASAAAFRGKHVIPCFPKVRKITPIILTGPNDVRPNFEKACRRKGVVYISGIGHGSATVFTGYRGDRLWIACRYSPEEVKGKLIHLLSCKTARELGPDLIKKGGCAYFGYIENFTITWNYPKVFWKCDSAIDLALCHGMNAEEATRFALRVYNAMIKKYRGIHGPTAAWLTWDRDALRTPVHSRKYGEPKGHLRKVPFLEELETELTELEVKDVEIKEELVDTKKLLEDIMEDP